jgi:hypothetical protein
LKDISILFLGLCATVVGKDKVTTHNEQSGAAQHRLADYQFLGCLAEVLVCYAQDHAQYARTYRRKCEMDFGAQRRSKARYSGHHQECN